MAISTGSDARQGTQLDKPEWARHFDDLTKRIARDGLDLEVTIEIVGEKAVGTEAERMPLNSITYEDGDEQVAIAVGGRGRRYPSVLWHYVDRPQLIWIHEHDGVPTAIAIESGDGMLTLVQVYPAGS